MGFSMEFRGYPQEQGPIRVGQVPWDTQRYGFPFYEVRLGDGETAATVEAVASFKNSLDRSARSVLVTRVPTTAVRAMKLLTEVGFFYVETAVTMTMPFREFRRSEAEVRLDSDFRLATRADLPEIKAMAGYIFATDRFHTDPYLPSTSADERFQNWVDQSFEQGDEIWINVFRATKEIVAWVIMRPLHPLVVISLGAVHPKHQSRSLSRVTIGDALETFRARGYEKVSINVSLNNPSIIRSVAGLGFNFSTAEHILHCHLGVAE